jgi:YD repeat-containing protein
MPEKYLWRWTATIFTLVIAPVLAADAQSRAERRLPEATAQPGGTGAYLEAVSNAAAPLAGTDAATSGWTERYEYDALGRLRKVTFANGATTRYTIDKAGNRTALNATAP